jgi:cytochrome P450
VLDQQTAEETSVAYSADTLATLDVIANPYPAYAALRADSPVPGYTDQLHGTVPGVDPRTTAWALLTYEHVAGALRDNDTYSSFDPIQAAAEGATLMLGNTDPPLHTIQRKLVNKAFTRARVAAVRPWIEQQAAELVAQIPAGQEYEMVHSVCEALPASVMCEFLGSPPEHAPRYGKWVSAFMLTSAMSAEERIASNLEMGAHFQDQLEARVAALDRGEPPAPGLMSALLQAEADGHKLPFEDVLNICATLMVAGSETSMFLFGNLVNGLVAYPEAVARVREDRSLIPDFINETLRLSGPVQRLFRIALRDVELAGKTIKKGDWVACFFGAANRDPAMFPEPDEFQLDRPNSAKHLTLGLGIHYCLGAPLASLEAECLINAILDRFPRIERGPSPVVPQTATLLHCTNTQLPIVFWET